ncbi:MAG TPA: hypothetical protein DEQ03_14050, partial [Marinilabiliales bacterium]|nr:hypothetical protein [Marinilabiliales bacterium]
MYISQIATQIYFHIDKLFISYFFNVSYVAYYQIASSLSQKFRAIPALIISPIFPAASELQAKNDTEKIVRLYLISLKYLVSIGLFICGGVIIFAHPFITFWLGDGYERTSFTLQLLFLSSFVNILTGPGFFILNGLGKPEYGMYTSLLS